MGQFTDRVGETYKNNKGEDFTIIRYKGNKDVDIQFEDGTIVTNRGYGEIRNKGVRNPNTPSVYGVGYMGQGKYVSSINGKHTNEYAHWKNIIVRCYCEKELIKCPSYIGITVCKKWHNFQNFAKWYEKNYKENFEVDKDILLKGNKIYSPETCCLVPQEINKLFCKADSIRGKYPIGVSKHGKKFQAKLCKNGDIICLNSHLTVEEAFQDYKIAKELYIKELADKYKSQITEPTYYAMYRYEVEITD